MGNGASTTTAAAAATANAPTAGNHNNNISTSTTNSASSTNRNTTRENNSNSMLTGSIASTNIVNNTQHNGNGTQSISSTPNIINGTTSIGTTNSNTNIGGAGTSNIASGNVTSASSIIQNGIVITSTGMLEGAFNNTTNANTVGNSTNRNDNTDWPVSRWLGVRTELDIFDDDFLESIPYTINNGVGAVTAGHIAGVNSGANGTNATSRHADNYLLPSGQNNGSVNSITTILNNMNVNDEAEMVAPTLASNIGGAGTENSASGTSSSNVNTISPTTTSTNAGSSKLNVRNNINGTESSNSSSNSSKHNTTLNMALWMADVNNHVLSQHAYKTLSVSLSRQCRRSDAFSRRVSKQLFALQHVHSALTTFSLNVEHLVETRIRKQNELLYINTLTSPTSKRNNIVMHGNNLLNNDGTPCSHDAKLGISLFFTLLDCVNDEDATLEERQAFLYDLNPLIQELGLLDNTKSSDKHKQDNMRGNTFENTKNIDLDESIDNNASNNLSLSSLTKDSSNTSINSYIATTNSNAQLIHNSNSQSSRNEQAQNDTRAHPFALFQQNTGNLQTQNSAANLGILDAIRDFLYSAALPPIDECELLNEINVLNEKEKKVAGKLHLPDRTSAITSLIALACVRGSLCDLLMAVKILLCVSWSDIPEAATIKTTKKGESKDLINVNNPSTNDSSDVVNDTTVLLKRLNPIDSKANEDKKNKLIKKKKRGQQSVQEIKYSKHQTHGNTMHRKL